MENERNQRDHTMLQDKISIDKVLQELKESEERYRLIFENITQGFALHEILLNELGEPADYRYLTVNPAFEKLTGIKANTIIGKRVLELLPNLEPYWIEKFGHVAITGEPITYENFTAEIGKHFETSVFCPKKGQFAVVFSDITERKQIEDSLIQKNNELEAAEEEIRATNEELVTANNSLREKILELQSAEEELRASSEELASMNDALLENFKELQSAEEEIRAANEKLANSNDALNQRMKELAAAKSEVEEKEMWLRESQRIGKIGTYKLNVKTGKWTSSQVLDEIFGIDDSYEKDIKGWHSLIHPEHSLEMVYYFENDVLKNHQTFDKDYKIIRKSDGSVRWLWGLGELTFDPEGSPVEMMGTIQDITEQKEAKQALKESAKFNQSLMQTIPFGMDVLDENGTILFINKKLSNQVGNDAIGKKCYTIYSDNPAQCKVCPIKKGINIGETGIVEISEILKGKTLEICYTGMMFRGQKANLRIFQDVTDRKKAEQEIMIKNAELQLAEEEIRVSNEELVSTNIDLHHRMEELKQAKEIAEEANRLKTSFLHNISHEIRTPLNAIVGFSDLISNRSYPEEQVRQFTQIIQQGSEQLTSVITDIINIATIEAGQLKKFEKRTDINAIIRNLFSQYVLKVEEKDINLFYKQLTDVNPIIHVDETKVTQILSNLIGNAIKFSDKGTIEYGCNLIDGYLQFYVKDEGIGITEDQQEKVFERFLQIKTADNREYGGNGLGLSIAKAYVELLGGKIWIKSELAKGSTFYFTIPYIPLLF